LRIVEITAHWTRPGAARQRL